MPRLPRASPKRQEKNEPLSLLMADIDHFKIFNDKYGHLTGDQVLRLVAIAVKQNVKGQRHRGALWRRGIRHRAAEHGAALGDHGRRSYPARRDDQGIDEAIERRTARPRDDLDRRRGAAPRTIPPQSLIERADKCLYAAKRNGRNRVICETDPEADADASKPRRAWRSAASLNSDRRRPVARASRSQWRSLADMTA